MNNNLWVGRDESKELQYKKSCPDCYSADELLEENEFLKLLMILLFEL